MHGTTAPRLRATLLPSLCHGLALALSSLTDSSTANTGRAIADAPAHSLAYLVRRTRRRFRISRPWRYAPAHPLVSGEGASTLFPQSLFTYAGSPKTQVANQTTTRLRTAIDLPGRQPPHRWRGKLAELRSDFQCRSLRDHAVFDKAPERNHEFPRQCDNADFPTPHALVGEALLPPQ